MSIKEGVRSTLKDLDVPLEQKSVSYGFFKKGKIRVIMIYEDLSFMEFWVKIRNPYSMTIKKRRYIMIPECIIKGKSSTIVYYFNNPFPIKFDFQESKLTALHMVEKNIKGDLPEHLKPSLSKIALDAGTLDVAFSSNLINKMYAESRITPKMIIIFVLLGLFVVLVILQLTGQVDVLGALRGVAK